MKKVIIIVAIVLVVGLLIWLYLRSRKPKGTIMSSGTNQVGNASTIGKPCPNNQLAAPPPGKDWSCINGSWQLVDKKGFGPGPTDNYTQDNARTLIVSGGGKNPIPVGNPKLVGQ
jgi:hypothetical protein